MLLEIKTLVPREVTLVSMVNCWCAEMVLVRGSGDIFFLQHLLRGNCDGVQRETRKFIYALFLF